MVGEIKMMEVMNGIEGLKGEGVLGLIEKECVSAKENMRSGVDSSDIEIKRENKKESFSQFEKIPVKSVPEAAGVNTAVEVKLETKEEGAVEIKLEHPESEVKMDLNADLERAAIERLAGMERLAEKERQDKIIRREELDRLARLQRILALVRAPELDSIAKMKQAVDLDPIKMTSGEESTVLKELNPVLKMEKVKVKKVTDLKPLAGQEPVVEKNLLVKKKIMESEGIAKLERMSKSERISEIDRLTNLELEAEAKRNAEVERIAELERLTELERVAKMKHLTEIDLPLEMEKVEKERLVEKERQEKIRRKEELDRVAKLQRVLAMVLASESDQFVEEQAANLKRVKEMNRRDELKLLEELGVIPKKQVTKSESEKEVKPVEGEHLVATVATDADTDSEKGIMSVTEVKEIIPTKSKQETKGDGVEDGKVANVKQRTELQNTIIKKGIIVEAETEEKIKRAAEMEVKARADREARFKRREELVRVPDLQRVAAMVHNEEFDHVPEMEKKNLERISEKKRREDMKVLEELGLVTKDLVRQESEINSKAVEEKYGLPEMKPVEGANIETTTKIEPTERKLSVEVKRLPAIEIEQMSENERIAVKRDIERRLTELRVAQMKRVAELGREMITGSIEEQENMHGEFKRSAESEPKTTEGDNKLVEELKSLKKTEVPEVIQEVGVDSKMKGVEESQPEDIKADMEREGVELIIGMEAEKPADLRRLLEKRETVFESMELKRIVEMKRMVGMERVRTRDCEWDGQMMYVGKV